MVESAGSDLGDRIAIRTTEAHPTNARYRLGQTPQLREATAAIIRPTPGRMTFYHATPDNMSFVARLVRVI
jgi:hypothetical protein